MQYNAYVVNKDTENQVTGKLQSIEAEPLADGEVRIRVEYSSLNYKDALAAQGHRGVVKSLPHVPGIDAAGTVAESKSTAFKEGDQVIATSYELGAGRAGGWAEYVDAPAEWVIAKPAGLSLRESMILGTAGLTAAMCTEELQRNEVHTDDGEIVVTGASGGVGSLAVKLLAHLGYRVVAISGKQEKYPWLKELGAAEILPREAVQAGSDRPMLKSRWAGAIDTVGGETLTTIIRSLQEGGCVAACGLVGGDQLPLTVHPFILRGAVLAGVSTANCPRERREVVWEKLAGDWKLTDLEGFAHEVKLAEIATSIESILAGKVFGRTLVKI
jgi:putative YhdH/YhfP family quinone oxidoreductase